MKKIISMMAMAMVLVWSCQEKDELGTVTSGKVELAGAVTDGQIVAGPEGGSFQVNVTSSGDWRVSGLSEWVTLSTESGKSGQPLTFTVLPYEGDKARTVTYKVFSADAVEAVTITQNPLYTISLVSEETVNLNSDANHIAVSLISNVEDLEVDFGGAEDWISMTAVSDAFGKKIVEFDVVRSSEFKERTAVVTLGAAATDDVVTVTVNQAQRDTAFVVGEQKIVKGLEALSLDLVIKSNVDVTYSLPTWLSQTVTATTEKDETGLQSKSITLTADACGGSRSATISFRSSNQTVGSVLIKQQNPNPIFADIPDENLRYYLESKGWIIPEDGIKCELVEAGISGTSLVIGDENPNFYGSDPIKSIEGLESFPNLEKLTLGNIQVAKVDVSSFPKLNELKLINLMDVTEINTGSRPITDVTNVAGTYAYTTVKEIVIKGEKIQNIDFSAGGYYLWYEEIESIDVTGCPELVTLNVYRCNMWDEESSLKYVYMTAEQKESVTVTKRDKVELVVK